jgi:hypothetical protein
MATTTIATPHVPGGQKEKNIGPYHFLVIGLFGAGPVTVQFEERPYVNQELVTGDGWQGVPAGQKLRVTYVSIKHEDAPRYHLFPHSMIYVLSI